MSKISIMENFHFNCLQGMYFSKSVPFEHGLYLSSDLIDDSYYNYVTLVKLNQITLDGFLKQATEYFASINRTASVYVTPSSDLDGSELIGHKFEKQYSDAWMILDDSSILNTYTCDSQIAISKVDSQSVFLTFVETFREAYSGDNPDDPYANLSPTYVESLKNSYILSDKFKRHHYLAYLKGVPVGVASAIECDGVVAVYNVGTITKYRKSGIGKAIMAEITKDFLNASILFLQTEHGSYVEDWYKSMGYKTMFLGECYSAI